MSHLKKIPIAVNCINKLNDAHTDGCFMN